jgi:predicted TIM-barrel fold metal-dependent hydrolase
MEIIDVHAHCFPDNLAQRAIARVLTTSPGAKNWTDGTLAGLRRSMKSAGVTKSVVLPVATKASQVMTINRGAPLLRADDIIPFGALHPAAENIDDEVSFMKANGIRGIKLHPEFQNFFMDDPAVFPLYEALAAAGLIVVFHTGTDPGPFTNDHSLPHSLAKVHKEFPTLRIVASHMGGHQVWDEAERHLVGLPMYFETSTAPTNFSPEKFVGLCRRHGIERILFGTDTPWYDQKFDREWIEGCGLTDKEKEMVFYKNAQRLLKHL